MMLTDEVFEKLINGFNLSLKEGKIAVAVSGGADSLCLLYLLNNFCKKMNVELTALTVDHQLRKESLKEAKFVQKLSKKMGVLHEILIIKDKISGSGVEAQAREKRYSLLTDYCVKKNIPYLFVAHHQFDQAETFLSRLARGSGLEGLSSIKPVSSRNGIFLIRPFLTVSKKDIVAYLKKHEINWVEDPMNQDEQYERVKWRKFLPVLEKKGIDSKSICLSVARLNRAQQALDIMTDDAFKKCVMIFDEGYALIQKEYNLLPDEIKIRVLLKTLKMIGRQDKIISLELLERVVLNGIKKTTLAHCHVIPHKRGIFVAKESSRMEARKKIKKNKPTKWDRFIVTAKMDGYIMALDPLIRKKNIPFLVQKSFPFFCDEKSLENGGNIQYNNSSIDAIDIKFIKC